MEYLIAGIRIDIPHRFTTGAFGMALAPFAAGNKTETDAPVSYTHLTLPTNSRV